MNDQSPSPPETWTDDILHGFEQMTLTNAPSFDGPVELVLVRRKTRDADPQIKRAAVLYIHGFIDYFFQTHLADFYAEQGLDFYALDLRRHGRALRPHQTPNFMLDIDEFLADVDLAVHFLKSREQVGWLLLNGHSTGGLVAALYAHRGPQRAAVDALFLNSPFLDMNVPAWQGLLVEPLLAWLGKLFPRMPLPGLPQVYGKSIHAEHHGEWRFDQRWKPVAGFPVYAGWLRAIHLAQAEVARGLNITCPCLILHAEHSLRTNHWSPAAMGADTVLDVADMRRLAPRLGKNVETSAIPGGLHDLVLSNSAAREMVWEKLRSWLAGVRLRR